MGYGPPGGELLAKRGQIKGLDHVRNVFVGVFSYLSKHHVLHLFQVTGRVLLR